LGDHFFGSLVGLLLVVGAELDQQPSVAPGEQLGVALEALAELVIE
jgi:hypothetical protein